jgi:hypothetical protein
MTKATKHAVALRDFNDEGQQSRHKKDDVLLDLDAGRFDNYEHSGLVREAKAEEVKKAKEAADKAAPAA